MPVEFLDDEAIADIAFKVRADTIEELFKEACNTVFHLQTDTTLLEERLVYDINLNAASLERLLYNVLADILFYRDAEFFFGKTAELEIIYEETCVKAIGSFTGELFDEERHPRWNDVKAITMHDFYVKKVEDQWEAYILVDI